MKTTTILFLALTFLLTGCSKSHQPLPLQAVMQNTSAFEGHTYDTTVTIVNQIESTPKNTLVIVQELNATSKFPVIIPTALQLQLFPEQRYKLTVIIQSGNLIVTTANKL